MTFSNKANLYNISFQQWISFLLVILYLGLVWAASFIDEQYLTLPTQNFEMFRKEMDKLGKKLRVVERECADWREKFDASNEQVRRFSAIFAMRASLQVLEDLPQPRH